VDAGVLQKRGREGGGGEGERECGRGGGGSQRGEEKKWKNALGKTVGRGGGGIGGAGGEREIERDRERGRENRVARVVVGRAGGRRDTPRRTGWKTRVETWLPSLRPSCAVGRPRHAPTSRDAASGLSAVAPVCGAIGVTCAPAQAGASHGTVTEADHRGCGAGRGSRRCNFQSTRRAAPRGHRLFGTPRRAAPHRDVSIIDSTTLHFDF